MSTPNAPGMDGAGRLGDGFDEAAAAKLYALLPAVHRTADSAVVDGPGPLRELLDRIAGQVAVARRGLDRLWENQSAETCDDWVLPYLADLLGTNLVASMTAREQRLDVANTIGYRRRKGTVGLLEQLAADVTGWECRVVEFFRLLGRTRHGLDPEIGRPADATDPSAARRLQAVSGLTGLLTGTPAGGFADLRGALGAGRCNGPFDEFPHTADVRRGEGALGWYGVPKVGVFLWRSVALAVDRATPVPVSGCPGHYSFDPTGRQIALWQRRDRPPAGYQEEWISLAAWQVPEPLTGETYRAVRSAGEPGPAPGAYPDARASLWPSSLAVRPLGSTEPLTEAQVRVWPEAGRFAVDSAVGPLEAGFHYGLCSRIGAGPYDRHRIGSPPARDPLPVTEVAGGTGDGLRTALAALNGSGTVVVTSGLTNTAVAPTGSPTAPLIEVTVRADDGQRAVVRPAEADGPWVFHGSEPGADPTARLRLEGLLLSGQDIVLRGVFAQVTLSCCTIDPGTGGELCEPPTVWQPSADGRDLVASRIWIEGTVRSLALDRCITGPVRERRGGTVETLCAADSVLQALPADEGGELTARAVFDPDGLLRLLRDRRGPLTTWLHGRMGPESAAAVAAHTDGAEVPTAALDDLVADLNDVLHAPLWDAARFAGRSIATALVAQAEAGATGTALVRVNRALLAAAFPLQLAGAALALGDGIVCLDRCTVLGPAHVHRIEASESVLDGVVRVTDTQDGCVRFSAWSTGSALPRRYESVELASGASVFASRRYGEAGYAQLSDSADASIQSGTGAGRPSIRTGSRDGSEMGAFCRDGVPLKERSLLIKYREFLPVGLTPVLVPMPRPDSDGQTLRGRAWPPM
ncbi:phage tail protein [Streptomyces sp. NPDC059985]|uniref:phage tail protein n=1 Tax=Streptomyces sp. NPDC059985 TaxID=3347025 RepID=UPI0036BA606E